MTVRLPPVYHDRCVKQWLKAEGIDIDVYPTLRWMIDVRREHWLTLQAIGKAEGEIYAAECQRSTKCVAS